MAGAGFVISSRYAFAASDFWNKKEPADWSPQEIETMKTKSPWAKKVHGEMSGGGGSRGGGGGGGSRGGGGGMGEGGGGGMGEGGGGRGGGGGSRGGGGGADGGGFSAVPQGPEVVIRWENADPILAATKFQLPPNLANHYAISVTGLPQQMLAMVLTGGGRGGGRGRGRDREGKGGEGKGGENKGGEASQAEAPPAAPATPEEQAAQAKARQDRLLNSVTLAAKGKDPQHADLVMQTSDKQTLIFGFPKEILPLAANDKDVEFVMHVAVMTIKAKFEPKEMMFKGSLNI
jgi:hypothetical protein